jgi:hypothetical protein
VHNRRRQAALQGKGAGTPFTDGQFKPLRKVANFFRQFLHNLFLHIKPVASSFNQTLLIPPAAAK